jgi:hypothetical protein
MVSETYSIQQDVSSTEDDHWPYLWSEGECNPMHNRTHVPHNKPAQHNMQPAAQQNSRTTQQTRTAQYMYYI